MDWNGITDNSDLSLRSVRKKTALKSRSVTNAQPPETIFRKIAVEEK